MSDATQPLRVVIVDDHALTRQGMKMTLRDEPGVEVIATLDRGQDAVDVARGTCCDVVLLDLDLPDISGKSVLAELVGVLDTTVIVVTGTDSATDLGQVLRAGARGIVGKGDEPEHLLEAIAASREGKRFISPSVAHMLADYDPPSAALSPRQTAILGLVAEGVTNKEIAYRLGIAAPTVSFHLAQLREKLGASNNRQIVARARELGHI